MSKAIKHCELLVVSVVELWDKKKKSNNVKKNKHF